MVWRKMLREENIREEGSAEEHEMCVVPRPPGKEKRRLAV